MFPNVLQQEIVNYLNVCTDINILQYLKKANKKIWYKHSKKEIRIDEYFHFKRYYINGVLHRDEKYGPAEIHYEYGKIVCNRYYQNDLLHRQNGPALEYPGSMVEEWWLNGKLHHLDGPAVVRYNGTKEWFLNGVQHRENGPATEFPDGHKNWYFNGVLHRLDGPAIEYSDGLKSFYVHGQKVNSKRNNKPMIPTPRLQNRKRKRHSK